MKLRTDVFTPEQWAIIDAFHCLQYGRAQRWLGYPVLKSPQDMQAYHDLVYCTRPDTIIECGTGGGGSALMLASLLHLCGLYEAQVLTIDVSDDMAAFYQWAFAGEMDQSMVPTDRPAVKSIRYLKGSTVSPTILRQVKALRHGRTMVVLDSAHTKAHVLDELECYAPLVTPGCYLVLEDIDVHGHPVPRFDVDGPYEALEQWLPDHPEFALETHWRDQYLVSSNAYLRRLEGTT